MTYRLQFEAFSWRDPGDDPLALDPPATITRAALTRDVADSTTVIALTEVRPLVVPPSLPPPPPPLEQVTQGSALRHWNTVKGRATDTPTGARQRLRPWSFATFSGSTITLWARPGELARTEAANGAVMAIPDPFEGMRSPRYVPVPPGMVAPRPPVTVRPRALNDVPRELALLAPTGETDGTTGHPVYRPASIASDGALLVYDGITFQAASRSSLLPADELPARAPGAPVPERATFGGAGASGRPWFTVRGATMPGGGFADFGSRAIGSGTYAVENLDTREWFVIVV